MSFSPLSGHMCTVRYVREQQNLKATASAISNSVCSLLQKSKTHQKAFTDWDSRTRNNHFWSQVSMDLPRCSHVPRPTWVHEVLSLSPCVIQPVCSVHMGLAGNWPQIHPTCQCQIFRKTFSSGPRLIRICFPAEFLRIDLKFYPARQAQICRIHTVAPLNSNLVIFSADSFRENWPQVFFSFTSVLNIQDWHSRPCLTRIRFLCRFI